MAIDDTGEIYVSNTCLRSAPGSVLVFASTADGDIAPIRTLQLVPRMCEAGIWVDSAGYLYVAWRDRPDGMRGVAVYAPGADGMAQPVRQISGPNTRLRCPTGVTTDPGDVLYVADRCSVAVFEYSSTANGDIAPIAMIKGAKSTLRAPLDVKLGSDGKIFVADPGIGQEVPVIDVFAAGAKGNVAPVFVISPPDPDSNFIGGIGTHGTHLIAGIFDPDQNFNWAILTYNVGSRVVLLHTIEGPDTLVGEPFSEAVH